MLYFLNLLFNVIRTLTQFADSKSGLVFVLSLLVTFNFLQIRGMLPTQKLDSIHYMHATLCIKKLDDGKNPRRIKLSKMNFGPVEFITSSTKQVFITYVVVRTEN